ncbi:probable disease resistance protein At4g27220 isoform X2 [Argentina anserina]|uniref:probable disease resistance protein At4g27220 isoform X2 n=1 Tax=Argentina anserina TaxID=57926 RepID=UPI0021764A94|nr:probable disease resistance protein At4g27220 isoform X2 [Potentilla anserina]
MASSSQIACASPPSEPCRKYDVFLSFRGPDTRKGITVDIFNRLNSRGIKTFIDEQGLQVGDVISPALLAAIKQSRFAIVVLSENYASSSWCLEELREICLSMEDNKIFPLFYHVDPTDVRFQNKGSFKEAFSKHETSGRYESEKVKQWKAALFKVANISGWNTNDHETHKALVDVIVEVLLRKVVPEAIETTGDFQVFEATRQAMNDIMKALKEDEVTAVGVYGMGGVGKTTLVEHVGTKVRYGGVFDYVIKGVISQNIDFEELQHALAEQLGFELHEKTEIGRAARLCKEIKRKERILIILDDIWERMELSKIGIPSHKELQKCNSKILLTTRIRNVCQAMGCQRKIALNVLSEQDSWALFLRRAGRSFESRTFEDVAKKIAGECKGLPIALVAVARALGDKELVEWKRASQQLEKSQPANPDDKDEAFKCIKFSYDYLKNVEFKSYFLLCCLFPEDYDIPMEVLCKYAIGKGLFQDAETLEEARETAESVARHLKYSGLLLVDCNDEFVRMHDVVRDAAVRIAQHENGFLVKPGCRLEDWPRKLHEGCSTISLMRNYICQLPKKLVCPKLQILLLNRNFFLEEIPESFFQSTNELTVLDLSFTSLSLLPQSFSLLTNLHSLYLDKCDNLMIDTSILGELKNLEILSMRDSGLKELCTEIGGLTNLRLLDITSPYIGRIPSNVISKLHNLEELCMQGFREWGSRVEGEGEETNAGFDVVTSLSKVRVLRVSIQDVECLPKFVEFYPKWAEFDIRIGRNYEPYDPNEMKLYNKKNCDRVNSILLEVGVISRLPNWFWVEIMKLAERLCLDGCRERLIDIVVESEYGRLQGLKQLHIQGPREIMGCKKRMAWVPRKPVFENLEVLKLLRLDCTGLCAVELAPGSLYNLKSLGVEACYNWGSILLPSKLLQRLINLEKLRCRDMENIEYVFGSEALLVSKQTILRKMKLESLPRVVSLCDGPAPPATFQNLQSLSIQRFHQLQGSLFAYDVAQCLSQLNLVYLHDCPLLERIVEASNKNIILPNLKKITLNELPMLYYESATLDIECPSLENLRVLDCPKFSASPSDFHSKNNVHFFQAFSSRDHRGYVRLRSNSHTRNILT